MGQVKAIDQRVGFVDKVNFFSKDFLKLCAYLHESEPARETFTKRLYAQMVSSSKLLEDFLDFHGAKNSSDWYYYRELVSSVRNLSEASYSQKHIYIRLPFYDLGNTTDFEKAGYVTHKFLINCLRTVCRLATQEAKRLDVALPSEPFVWDDFPGIPTEARLESDIDD